MLEVLKVFYHTEIHFFPFLYFHSTAFFFWYHFVFSLLILRFLHPFSLSSFLFLPILIFSLLFLSCGLFFSCSLVHFLLYSLVLSIPLLLAPFSSASFLFFIIFFILYYFFLSVSSLPFQLVFHS